MNYNRYKSYSEEKYNKINLSYYLMRKPCDNVIFPIIQQIEGDDILEVGPGFGYYTKYLIARNNVELAEINQFMCENLGLHIYNVNAVNLTKVISKKYDKILSFWMTEYLNDKEFKRFICQSLELLNVGGSLITTVINNTGLGWLYVTLAKIKGIKKYFQSYSDLKKILNCDIYRMPTYFNIPFAFLLHVKKK